MSDYKQTRDAAGNVTTQYDKMLHNLITEDAQTALTKMLAEARAEGMREAHKAVSELPEDAQKVWALEAIAVAMMHENAAANAIQKEDKGDDD